MTRLRYLLLLLGLALLVAPVPGATAADDPRKPDEPKVEKPKDPEKGPADRLELYTQLLPEVFLDRLNLTKEQKEKVDQLRKDFEDKHKEDLAKVKDAVAKAREAFQKGQEGDPEAGRKAGEQMREAMQSLHKLRSELVEKLGDSLNDEQTGQLAQFTRGGGPPFGPPGGPGGAPFGPPGGPAAMLEHSTRVLQPEFLDKLNLSKEEKEKAEKVRKDFEDKHKEDLAKVKDGAAKIGKAFEKAQQDRDPEAMRKIGPEMGDLMKTAHQLQEDYVSQLGDVLSEENKTQLKRLTGGPPFGPPGGNPFGPPGGPPFGPPGGPGGFWMPGGDALYLPPPLQQELKLTDEQKEKIRKLQQEFEDKVKGVLTDEQKKAYDEGKKHLHGPGPGGPGPGPGSGGPGPGGLRGPGQPPPPPPEKKPDGEAKPPEKKPEGEAKPPETKPEGAAK